MSMGCGVKGFKSTEFCVRSYACIVPFAVHYTPMV